MTLDVAPRTRLPEANTDQASTTSQMTRTHMTDAAALRDPLMDWVYEQAGGDVTVSVEVRRFVEAQGADLDTAFTLVHLCQDAGLVRSVSGYGNPCVLLTPAGIADVGARR